MFSHHSDQMSQRSQVSWVALFMSIIKVLSQSVTRSPIELFWTAKNMWTKMKIRPCAATHFWHPICPFQVTANIIRILPMFVRHNEHFLCRIQLFFLHNCDHLVKPWAQPYDQPQTKPKERIWKAPPPRQSLQPQHAQGQHWNERFFLSLIVTLSPLCKWWELSIQHLKKLSPIFIKIFK